MSYLKTYAVLLALLIFSPVAQALHWNLFYRLCPEEIVEIPPFIEEFPIPVGCEVIDCCPGCPGPGYIDWRINIDKTLMRGARLRIAGMTAKNLGELKISGDASITKQGDILLGTGEISIAGLPDKVNGEVPLAFVTPLGMQDQAAMVKMAAMQDSMDKGDDADSASGIQIRQYRGPFQVNSFRTRFALRPCIQPLRGDYLKLTNNTANDSAVAMLDYRQTACHNDFLRRLTSSSFMGNVLSNASCRSTVSVFSDDNAMSYEPNVTTWTNANGDEHTVNLGAIITVPVSVWVANNAALTQAQNDFANANLLYNQNNVGVQFNPTYTSFSGNAAATATIGTGCPATNAAGNALQASAWYTANRLNAYYVNSAFTGVNCGFDRNMNFIGTTANLGSLPHEFGHAYALRPSASNGHTNGVAGFGNNNLMWGGGPGTRDHFSVGQAFRINTDTTSMLNVNGDRTGPTETCLPNVTSIVCPALSIDSLPH